MSASPVQSSFSVPSPSGETEGVCSEIRIREACGLKHEPQVIQVALPETVDVGHFFSFQTGDGRLFPGQRSRTNVGLAYVRLSLEAFEELHLLPVSKRGALPFAEVSCQVEAEMTAVISNGRFSLKVFVGEDTTVKPAEDVAGPVLGIRVQENAWRGRTFIDSRLRVNTVRGVVLEPGPVRLVYSYRVEFEGGGFYEALITVDASHPFAKIEETFSASSGDQIVWDFSGTDLPAKFYALDSSAAYKVRPVSYHYDTRLARLAAWTQQSQHLDFVDGFALGFRLNEEVIGFVTLEGGTWRGAKLNHMEPWVRRWLPGDPASRRDLPGSAKADSYPGPERVPARGGVVCEEHFNVEGWIGNGRRKFALVLAKLEEIQPTGLYNDAPLGHFEDRPDRERYARQQSSLRKIHTQYGVMPLQQVMQIQCSWPEEAAEGEDAFTYPHEVITAHFRDPEIPEPRSAATDMLDYLAARVYGFWEGSGIAYSNPVVSRRIVPEMFRYEWLVRNGALTSEEKVLARSHFAFLTHLFASENYYTGDAAMLPAESPDSTEPTLAGMANQNFCTDVFNVLGAGAQVFHLHPEAGVWRDRFIQQWHRQLEFHMYPESGLWEESHTYYAHVLHTVLPTLLRRRADGVDDEFQNPAMQKLVGGALKQVTTRDACFDNRRYLIAFGDHDPSPKPELFQALANAFSDANPLLSSQFAWMACEMGGASGTAIKPAAPAWTNEMVQGLGVMFRGTDRSGQESLFALRSGCAWGHHHNDDGSIQFFAKGRSLIVDSAFGMGQEFGNKVEAAGHSRWSLKDLRPVNYYWRFNRGWVTDSKLDGRFPFANCYSPVFSVRGGAAYTEVLTTPVQHWRSVMQLGATTYLVVDRSSSEYAQVVRFHLAGVDVAVDQLSSKLQVPEGSLFISPLFTQSEPRLTVHRPSEQKAVSRYSTTEVCFDLGVSSFAAFLLHAGEPNETFSLSSSPERCTVRTSEAEYEILRPSPYKIVVTDRTTAQAGTLDLINDVVDFSS